MIQVNKKRLNEFLKFKRWSMNELARQMGRSSSDVSMIISGKRQPSRGFMEKLCQVVDEPLGELFFCE